MIRLFIHYWFLFPIPSYLPADDRLYVLLHKVLSGRIIKFGIEPYKDHMISSHQKIILYTFFPKQIRYSCKKYCIAQPDVCVHQNGLTDISVLSC